MELDHLVLNTIDFPGRAGELQRSGATAAFLRELGDNYSQYHEVLRSRLEQVGGDADPNEYRDDPGAYGRHVQALQQIAISERVLRRARAFRREGRSLSDPGLGEPPTWDAEYTLVNVEHPERSRFSAPWERSAERGDPEAIVRLAGWPPSGPADG